jgi:hypothetical protein
VVGRWVVAASSGKADCPAAPPNGSPIEGAEVDLGALMAVTWDWILAAWADHWVYKGPVGCGNVSVYNLEVVEDTSDSASVLP